MAELDLEHKLAMLMALAAHDREGLVQQARQFLLRIK